MFKIRYDFHRFNHANSVGIWFRRGIMDYSVEIAVVFGSIRFIVNRGKH